MSLATDSLLSPPLPDAIQVSRQSEQNLSDSSSGLFANARNILVTGGTFVILNSSSNPQKNFDKLPHSSDRTHKNRQSAPTPVTPSEFRPRGSVETDPAPDTPILSDISAVDPDLDCLSPVERAIHILRTGASLANCERRRCMETRKRAVSQGNIALASEMKREVTRYTALMQSFNHEAELKAMEAFTNSHHQNDKEDQKTASSSRERGNQLESQRYGMVLGVDLGTYPCIGEYKGRRVEIIPNDQDKRITPSWVGFHSDERLIGDSAKNSFHSNAKNMVFDAKHPIAHTIEVKHLPFMVKEKNGAPMISVTYEDKMCEFAPEEFSAMILGRMKETAAAYLNHGVTHAVLTVPSHFNDAQRQATKNAGEMAGLKVLLVLNDPIATALALGRGKTDSESKLIVYDLGGGTFDVSLLSIGDGFFEILATGGDTHLGGEDFDNRVVDYLVKAYKKKTGRDISSKQRAKCKLKKAVELAKHTLSVQLSAKIEIENFENGNRFLKTLTRAKFEELNLELFKRTMKSVEQVLKDAEVTKSKIDEVILAGGSTRIPKIQELLRDYFSKEPSRDINPEDAKVTKSEIDEVILVGGSTRIPRIKELLKDYFGKELSRDINPDEAVVFGTTIQAPVFSGQAGISVLDINPLTVGIEVNGGTFVPIIKRNTVIPTKKTMIFSTASDNQRTMMIRVFEGEREQTKFNHFLGKFKLVGIPQARKGVIQVEVIFELDANSSLTITAVDKRNGHFELVVITYPRKQW